MALFDKKKLREIQNKEKVEKAHSIMIVDDEEGNLNVLSSMLSEKYRLFLARDGQEALKLLEEMERPEDISLIISDQRMPNLTGTQLFEQLIPIIPDTVRIILTGFTDISAIIDSINKARIHKFIVKPFEPHDLLLTVERGLETFDLKRKVDSYHRTLEQRVEERTRQLREKNAQITSSIRYAKTIQKAILPAAVDMKEVLPKNFVLFKPRDIVSGDFYWFDRQGGNVYLAAVDCTGHGVPGAFMSMIGYILLNEIITENRAREPAGILKQLNREVCRALKQKAGKGAADGMDMALCHIDTTTRNVVFAGAKSSFYCVRENGAAPELTVVKGDRLSIGGRRHDRERSFTNHQLQLNAGDMIYLASDGFTDQCDHKQKKFGSKRFKELLRKISPESVETQKEMLIRELANHQGNEEQRDDITVVGVRL